MLWWLAQNTVSAAVLALPVLLVCRFCNLRPSLRHALWLLVLLKLVSPPLVAWPWNPLEFAGLSKPEKAGDRVDFTQLQVVNLVEHETANRGTQTYRLALPDSLLEEESSPVPATSPTLFERLAFLQPWLLGVWLTGAGLMLIVQVIRAGRFRRLMRGWRPAPRRLRHQVARLSREMKLRSPRCLVLPGLHSPFIWSLLRPWLIWPAPLHEHLSPEAHKTVIVHELAHLRRRDHWVGWLQLVGECVFWWNPLFWFVRRQIRFQAELACDAWVMRLLPGARRAYAEALIEVTALISRAPAPVPALGMSSAARQDFERRLTMIMNDKVPGKAPLLGVAAIGLIGLAVLPGFSQDTKASANPQTFELVSSGFNQLDVEAVREWQNKNDQVAKVDSLIVELDALIERMNAGQEATGPGQNEVKKVTSDQELKLIEAVELAYSDALLLKEGDDTQSEKSREEKIKQIEKNLQTLLKEVQSLKGGSQKPVVVKPGTVKGKIVNDKKLEGDKQIELKLELKDGKLEGPHNLHLNLGELKLDGARTFDVRPLVLRLDGQGKGHTFHVTPDVKAPGAHEIKVEVRTSEDGKSLIINGKPVPLPKDGKLELKSDDGHGVIIFNVDEHHSKVIEDKKEPKEIKAEVIFETKDEHINKDGKPHVFNAITIDKSAEGAPHIYRIITDEKGKDGKPHGFTFTPGMEKGSGKVFTEVIGGEFKLNSQDGKPVKVITGSPFTTKTVAPGTKDENISVWTTVAPGKATTLKSEDGKHIAVWTTGSSEKPADGQVKTWAFVESNGKGQNHSVGVYKLPKGKAAAIAAFLKENVKGASVETKVEGDTLTVHGSPEAVKAVASLISLMQGKAATEGKKAQPTELKYELRLVPDGKDSSSKNFEFKPFVNWTTENAKFTQNFGEFKSDWTGFTELQPNFKWSAKPFFFEGKAVEGKGAVKP